MLFIINNVKVDLLYKKFEGVEKNEKNMCHRLRVYWVINSSKE